MTSEPDLARRKDYARLSIRFALVHLSISPLILILLLFLEGHGALARVSYGAFVIPWKEIIRALVVVWSSLLVPKLVLKFIKGYRIEHAFGLSRETFRAWAKRTTKAELISFIFFLTVFGTVAALRLYDPEGWWISSSVLAILFFIILGKLVPKLILPLFYKTEPLEQETLIQWLKETCRNTHIRPLPLFSIKLGKETRKANAAVMGWGKARRMLISDTLLEGFELDEIKTVMAHELGHHKHRDFLVQLLFASCGTAMLLYMTHRLLTLFLSGGGPPTPAREILLLLLLVDILSVLTSPLMNAISRALERRADRFALAFTQMPQAMRTAFEKLARLNMADPSPARWHVWLFYDHPPIHERIQAAVEREHA
ncbi:MAG: M48 family metalloprotease [Candidatus Omnitrophica bacterium]|nr:M48 family metalloprotease [Candidatus Omnitrophota bacterium]